MCGPKLPFDEHVRFVKFQMRGRVVIGFELDYLPRKYRHFIRGAILVPYRCCTHYVML